MLLGAERQHCLLSQVLYSAQGQTTRERACASAGLATGGLDTGTCTAFQEGKAEAPIVTSMGPQPLGTNKGVICSWGGFSIGFETPELLATSQAELGPDVLRGQQSHRHRDPPL